MMFDSIPETRHKGLEWFRFCAEWYLHCLLKLIMKLLVLIFGSWIAGEKDTIPKSPIHDTLLCVLTTACNALTH
jgi:hypothetical protein